MKSKKTNFKKSKRSSFNDFEEKDGLKPVKSKAGKSSKKLSIYDELDDDMDLDMEDYSFKETDFEYENDIYDDDDDY